MITKKELLETKEYWETKAESLELEIEELSEEYYTFRDVLHQIKPSVYVRVLAIIEETND